MAILEVGLKSNILTTLEKLKNKLKSTDKGMYDLKKSTADVDKELNKFGRDAKESFNNANSGIKDLIKSFVAFETAKNIVTGSITSFMELEDAILGVQKTTGLSGDGLKSLTDELKNMATTTSGFPISDLLAIAENAGQLGIKGVDNIKAFTKEIQFMASSSKLSADEASTAFAQLANVLDIPIKNINQLTGSFTALASSTTATEGDLVDFTQRLAGAGKTLELTNAQIVGISATLKDVGISAEVGGTAMSQVFAKMATDAEAFAKIAGVSLKEFTSSMRDEPIKALKQFLNGLNSLDKVGRLQALKEAKLNGSGLSSTLLKLSANTSKLTQNINISTRAYKDGTATQKEYEVSAQSLSRQLTKVQSELKIAGAELGQKFTPAILSGAKALNTSVKFLTKYADDITEVGEVLAVATGAVVLFSNALKVSPIGRAIALTSALSVAVNELADAYLNVANSSELSAIASQKARNENFKNELLDKQNELLLKQRQLKQDIANAKPSSTAEEISKLKSEYEKVTNAVGRYNKELGNSSDIQNKRATELNTLLSQQEGLLHGINSITSNTAIADNVKTTQLKILGQQYNDITKSVKMYKDEIKDNVDINIKSNIKGEVKKVATLIDEVTSTAKTSSKKINSSFNDISTNNAQDAIHELRDKLFEIANIDIQIGVQNGSLTETEALSKEIELLKEKQKTTTDILDKKRIELDVETKANALRKISEEQTKKEVEAQKKIRQAQKDKLSDLVSLIRGDKERLALVKKYTVGIEDIEPAIIIDEDNIESTINLINEIRKVQGKPLLSSTQITQIKTDNETKKQSEELNKTFNDFTDTLGSVLKNVVSDIFKNGQVADGAVGNALYSSGNPYAQAVAVFADVLNASLSSPMDEFQKELANVGETNKGIKNSIGILNDVEYQGLQHTVAMREHLRSMDDKFNSIAIALSSAGGISGQGFIGGESFSQNVNFSLGSQLLGDSIGGLLDGIIGGFFGSSSTEIKQSGIDFGEQTIEGFLQGVEAVNFQVTETTKRALFGLIKSTGFSTQTSEISQELAQNFQEVIQDASETIVSAGVALGLNENDLQNSINQVQIDLGKFDFLGKSEDEIKATLEGVFGRALGDVASTVVPQIEQFRNAGEDYLTALTRVSVGIEQGTKALQDIGIDAVDFEDIKNKNSDVFSELIKESILNFETDMTVVAESMQNALDFNIDLSSIEKSFTGIGDIIDNMDVGGQELIQTYESLLSVQDDLRIVLGSTAELSQSVLNGSKGLKNLQQGQNTFLNSFFNDTEIRDRLQNALDIQLSNAGVKSKTPTTTSGFVNLIESVDVSTEQGAKQYGQLITLSSEVLELINLTDSINSEKEQAEKEAQSKREEALLELQDANRLAEEANILREKNFDETNTQLDIITQSGDVTNTIVNNVGGFDNLKEFQADYLENFRTDAEKTAFKTEELRKEFFALGFNVMPKTREELVAIVEALNLTTLEGQETYAGILKLVDSFSEVTDPITDVIAKNEEFVQSLKENGEVFKSLRGTITDTINNILDINQGKQSTESKFRQLVDFNKAQDAFNRATTSDTIDPAELTRLFSDIKDSSLSLANNFSSDTSLNSEIVRQLEFNKRLTPSDNIQRVEVVGAKQDTALLDKISFILTRDTEESVKTRKLLRDLLEEQQTFNATQASTV